jgi:guanylate kinase
VNDFLLLILSSPSGAGKTTLCGRLRQQFPLLRFSVSHTTRQPRANELDGREYHFVPRERFEAMVRDGQFVEWAEVHGNLYGTSVEEVEKSRAAFEGVLFDVDYQGARQIKVRYPEAVTVFVLPPSLQELERRLRSRASEDEPTIRRRLANALGEIAHYGLFDYVVENDQLEEASRQLHSIVTAERCRRWRRAAVAEQMLQDARSQQVGGGARRTG